MATNKRIICRIVLDIFILLCAGITIFLPFWASPYKRGFFCDDESLMYPVKESTIESWTLLITSLALPIGVILIVEIITSKSREKSIENSSKIRNVFLGFGIPDWTVECCKNLRSYFFGASACELIVHIGKYGIGRFRPHFLELCQPIMADGSTCADPKNHGKYIIDFSCSNPLATQHLLTESRNSFPSGHASSYFFTMVYLALYLQSRMTWGGSKLLKQFLQFVFIISAWYAALTRVSDYKHHWSDVFAGSAIGLLTAVLVANFVSDMFGKNSTESYTLAPFTSDKPTEMIISNGN